MKTALAMNLCVYVPRGLDETAPSGDIAGRFSDSVLLSPSLSSAGQSIHGRPAMPTTPTPSSSGLRLPRSGSKSLKKTCAICLTTMKPGQGHAIFTAECAHAFHFQCITSNVKHGNQICPVCRAKWKEVPFQSPLSDLPQGRARINTPDLPRDNSSWTTGIQRIPPHRPDSNRHISSLFHSPDPAVFDDDEHLQQHSDSSDRHGSGQSSFSEIIEMKTYPEVSAVSKSTLHENFNVLIHLKAPSSSRKQNTGRDMDNLIPRNSRASVDLVTVLDVSGSMAGTKLALLKRAMGFVIQNLGPSDRLSVISFSSTARRLFPLRRMTDTGRQLALQAVNSLTSNGGTNIAEGLKKGAKVMTDRKWKNPVSSIILLSDGQDNYTVNSGAASQQQTDYTLLVPFSVHRNGEMGFHIPVHTFGFGADHDAASMHSISETSGGTFSFIEAESVIQDAFAQCIGGLLSVVVQQLRVEIECVDQNLRLRSIKAGSYLTNLTDSKIGFINVGDLYAEEERDFLVTVDVPVHKSGIEETSLFKVRCVYRDPNTKELVNFEEDESNEVKIQRPELISGELVVSMEVDRQRNRLRAAEAMAEARAAAERGDLSGAVSVLESCRRMLSETVSSQAGDRLCFALIAELKEMQERMANRRVYEASGRAYVLSGLSSHSWQRATARGNSTDSGSLVQAYQTPSMVNMVTRSQTMVLGGSLPKPAIRPTRSFTARSHPR